MQKIFNNKAQKWLLKNPGRVISKFEIAEIASSAYTLALTPTNLISGFRKSGIYPYNNQAITSEMMAPSEIFVENLQESESGKEIGIDKASSDVQGMAGFLCGKLPKPADKVGKKSRNTLGKIVGGHDITSDSVIEKGNEHLRHIKNLTNNAPKEISLPQKSVTLFLQKSVKMLSHLRLMRYQIVEKVRVGG